MTDDWAKEKARELLRRLDTPGSAFSLEARGLPLLIAFASEAFRRGEESMREKAAQEATRKYQTMAKEERILLVAVSTRIRSLPVGGDE